MRAKKKWPSVSQLSFQQEKWAKDKVAGGWGVPCLTGVNDTAQPASSKKCKGKETGKVLSTHIVTLYFFSRKVYISSKLYHLSLDIYKVSFFAFFIRCILVWKWQKSIDRYMVITHTFSCLPELYLIFWGKVQSIMSVYKLKEFWHLSSPSFQFGSGIMQVLKDNAHWLMEALLHMPYRGRQ